MLKPIYTAVVLACDDTLLLSQRTCTTKRSFCRQLQPRSLQFFLIMAWTGTQDFSNSLLQLV